MLYLLLLTLPFVVGEDAKYGQMVLYLLLLTLLFVVDEDANYGQKHWFSKEKLFFTI